MRPVNPLDQDAVQEIVRRQQKMNELIQLARLKEDNHQFVDAQILYQQARPLAYYVGKGLRVTIIIEDSDRDKWDWINDKIKKMQFKACLIAIH